MASECVSGGGRLWGVWAVVGGFTCFSKNTVPQPGHKTDRGAVESRAQVCCWVLPRQIFVKHLFGQERAQKRCQCVGGREPFAVGVALAEVHSEVGVAEDRGVQV